MKGNCGECERRYFCEIDPDKCYEWPDPVPKTNADRLRAMPDEELAKIIQNLNLPNCRYCDGNAGCENEDGDYVCDEQKEMACIMRWLKQPAEGE